jgi:hypothetical protein
MDKVGIVMRQTTYNEEQAKQKLAEFNDDIEKVLDEYNEVEEEPEEEKIVSVNQTIYKEIRKFMSKCVEPPR